MRRLLSAVGYALGRIAERVLAPPPVIDPTWARFHDALTREQETRP